jgi:hypothetical protein
MPELATATASMIVGANIVLHWLERRVFPYIPDHTDSPD